MLCLTSSKVVTISPSETIHKIESGMNSNNSLAAVSEKQLTQSRYSNIRKKQNISVLPNTISNYHNLLSFGCRRMEFLLFDLFPNRESFFKYNY